LDIGVLGYIGIVQHKEHSPEVLSIPPGTPCIHIEPLSFSRFSGAFAKVSISDYYLVMSVRMEQLCLWTDFHEI